MEVHATVDAAEVLAGAATFLSGRPAEHNLILTLLEGRAASPQPGRYWVVRDREQVHGVAFQSPLTLPATITPMSAAAVVALVDAMADEGVELPGVTGEAATAARFAGHWTERRRSPAVPERGMRLYRLGQLRPPPPVPGDIRRAHAGDVELLIDWMVSFADETGQLAADPSEGVRHRVALGQFVVWDDGRPRATAATTTPAAGTVRIQAVFTPEADRSQGFGAACVAALSEHEVEGGHQCVLYTDLANPTSNSIYRRMGYEAIAEVLTYTFGAAHGERGSAP